MNLTLTLMTSVFYLAAIGALVAISVLAFGSLGRRRQSVLEPDVPRRDAAFGHRWNYSEILEYTHDAIIIWEMGGKGIVYWNCAAERIYGYPRAEALGKTTHRLLQTQLGCGLERLEATLSRFGVWAGELKHTAKSGERIAVQSRLALMSQQNGRWLVLEVNRDIGPEYREVEIQAAIQSHLEVLRADRSPTSTGQKLAHR